eukprot:TRINITY_DN7858_c0_g1_i1.p1 TRINITY_DN7858_c0_g1~~TRINITY_DN7858_c0_g1_i1.p1  ORF type:complete len:172 (-),score=45.48 TRINITY_DN7858_c0_g1_i1:147-662(-)
MLDESASISIDEDVEPLSSQELIYTENSTTGNIETRQEQQLETNETNLQNRESQEDLLFDNFSNLPSIYPYLYTSQRTATLKNLVRDLKKDANVNSTVVIHALYVFSGNFNLARRYLLNKDLVGVKPWSLEEDEVVKDAIAKGEKIENLVLQLVDRKSIEIEERICFSCGG